VPSGLLAARQARQFFFKDLGARAYAVHEPTGHAAFELKKTQGPVE